MGSLIPLAAVPSGPASIVDAHHYSDPRRLFFFEGGAIGTIKCFFRMDDRKSLVCTEMRAESRREVWIDVAAVRGGFDINAD